MKKKIFIFTICLSVMMGAQAQKSKHFISDDNYREKTEKAFNEKMQLIGKQFFDTKKLNANERELEALKFLYAYMALADATDYPTSFFYDNVKCSFTAQKEMPWGVKIPELLFRHFVLPVRVNNENLDESRMVFYKDLKERVKGMSMKEAILEVNHWCHERVTYQPSDARTSSPLASIRTAYGRCGEESTFTVAALRSIGIPARQVYTPRWAHTDDNHAWVEAWADGEWYFLGACEPEAVLNLGWFNAPASRAMLMHTRAFGDYNGPEEAVLRTNNYTEINLIDNYATTERIDFRVVDTNGKAVNGARVDFKIYNYAEYYTAVTKYTDERGETFLTAGLGDLIVWASHEGRYGFTKASFGKDKHITITLSRSQNSDLAQRVFPVEEFDIVPPPEKVNLPDVPEDMQKRNKERFAYEDSIRNAYVATFISQETASNFPAEATPYLIKARGNWQTILAFLEKYSDRKERAYKLLSTLSDKDLRDMQMDILDDNMNATSDQLCPRVENEMIILPFKQFFEKAFDKKTADRFRKNPSELVGWVKKNIRLNPDKKAIRIAQTPVGVWRSRVTDTRSRDIFFVDVARSLGIEAQKDGVTSKVQYKQDGKCELRCYRTGERPARHTHVGIYPDEDGGRPEILQPLHHLAHRQRNDIAPQLRRGTGRYGRRRQLVEHIQERNVARRGNLRTGDRYAPCQRHGALHLTDIQHPCGRNDQHRTHVALYRPRSERHRQLRLRKQIPHDWRQEGSQHPLADRQGLLHRRTHRRRTRTDQPCAARHCQSAEVVRSVGTSDSPAFRKRRGSTEI